MARCGTTQRVTTNDGEASHLETVLVEALRAADRAREMEPDVLIELVGFEHLRRALSARTAQQIRSGLAEWVELREASGLSALAEATPSTLSDARLIDLAERLQTAPLFVDLSAWVPTKQEMLFSYGLQAISRIIQSDGVVHPDEVEFLRAAVAPEALGTSDLFRSGKPTEKLSRAIEVAVLLLPDLLDDGDRTWLTSLVINACSADGVVHPEELEDAESWLAVMGIDQAAIAQTMRRLGLSPTPNT